MLSFLLVTIPVNLTNTLQSEAMLELTEFGKEDVYIEHPDYVSYSEDKQLIRDELANRQSFFDENNIDIHLHATYFYMGNLYADDPDTALSLGSFQTINTNRTDDYLEGTAPQLANEIAVSELALERIEANVGDYVHLTIGGESNRYLITGSYPTVSDMGFTVRLSENVDVEGKKSTIWLKGSFEDRDHIEEQIDQLIALSPEYQIITAPELGEQFFGGLQNTASSVQYLLLAIALLINLLITALMSKSFFIKDLPQIALLKNLGFRNWAIQLWQGLRILFVILLALIVGMLMSTPLNQILASALFSSVGAGNMSLYIIGWQIYLLYPLILLVMPIIVLFITTRSVKKIKLSDMEK